MRAYERLLKYVVVNTTSYEENEMNTPSGAGEFDLANLLAEEMKAMGLDGVRVDEHAPRRCLMTAKYNVQINDYKAAANQRKSYP